MAKREYMQANKEWLAAKAKEEDETTQVRDIAELVAEALTEEKPAA